MFNNIIVYIKDYVRNHSFQHIWNLSFLLFLWFPIFICCCFEFPEYIKYAYFICSAVLCFRFISWDYDLHPEYVDPVNRRKGKENFYKYLPEVSEEKKYIVVESSCVGEELEKLFAEENYKLYFKDYSHFIYKKYYNSKI